MGSSQLLQLESVLRGARISSADLKPHLVAVSKDLKARLAHHDAESVSYVKEAVRVLGRIKGGAFASVRYECFLECTPYLYTHGLMKEALASARGMQGLGIVCSRQDWNRRAENHLGAAYEGLGNLPEAVAAYYKALQLARQMGDVPGEVAVLTNIGAAFTNGALYREALPCFQAVIRLCVGDPNLRESEAIAFGNIAWVYSLLGDQKRAYEAISRATWANKESSSQYELYARATREWIFTTIALDQGRLAEAKAHSIACKEISERSGAATAIFFSDVANALVDIYTGDVAAGLRRLEELTIQTTTLEKIQTRADVLVVLVKAYQQVHRPQDALEAMRELLGHVRQRRELAVAALVSVQAPDVWIEDEQQDLQAMELREATLRATCAELRAVDSQFEVLERLATAATLREDPSGEHGYRVGRLSYLLAERLGWSASRCQMLEVAARLHDIGKVAVPDKILLNSAALQEEERKFMRSHTVFGAELLSKSALPQLRMAQDIARFHHEWWDGSGYPASLAGNRIPIHARIVALADVYDSLTHGRPYASAWPAERALSEIASLEGTQFDPDLVSVFVDLVRQLLREHHDLDAFLGAASRASPFNQARENLKRMLSSTSPPAEHL